MNKIPTAEEFVKYFRKQNPPAKFQTIESWMGEFCIEFAKLHRKAILEAAEQVYRENTNDIFLDEETKQLILNAYPENLIV